MFSDHFLDVHILVGSRLRWDKQYNSTTRYMAMEGIRRHTNQRVFLYHVTFFVRWLHPQEITGYFQFQFRFLKEDKRTHTAMILRLSTFIWITL